MTTSLIHQDFETADEIVHFFDGASSAPRPAWTDEALATSPWRTCLAGLRLSSARTCCAGFHHVLLSLLYMMFIFISPHTNTRLPPCRVTLSGGSAQRRDLPLVMIFGRERSFSSDAGNMKPC